MATEPVARTTLPASISWPSKEPPTLTLPSSVSEPWPWIVSMPFFSNSIATPEVRILMTLSRCAVAPEKSKSMPDTEIPKSFAPATSL